MKQYYPEVDILKGIAIALVILGHSIIFFPINLHTIPWCQALFQWVSSVHMPLFFLISGFCFHYGMVYKSYICRKIRRLLVPYFIFGFFDLFIRISIPYVVNRPDNLLNGIYKIFFYGGQYWFLYVLFEIFLIFPIIDVVK